MWFSMYLPMPQQHDRKARRFQESLGPQMVFTKTEVRGVGMKQARIGEQTDACGLQGLDDILVLGNAVTLCA
jgi:hypothetical protein